MNFKSILFPDLTAAAGLVLTLLLVIGLDRLLPRPAEPEPVPVIVETTTTTETTTEIPAKPPRLGITPTTTLTATGPWESMEEVLDRLGEGYKADRLTLADLMDEDKLAKYDILFFTCGQEENNNLRLYSNLRNFVEKGGTLYASDWRFEVVKLAFPEKVQANLVGHGTPGNVIAEVKDAGLQDVIGPTVNLHFRLSQWKSAGFGGPGVEQMLWGKFQRMFGPGEVPGSVGGWMEAPLLVRFHHGKGTVIFTSFHNEKENSDITNKLLKYMVLSVVTAKEHSKVTQSLVKGGFSPTKSNLMSASAGDQKSTQTFNHTKPGKVRFVLAFDAGAKLRLEIEGPGGKKYDQTATSSITIEVPDAAAGEWRCTVTALSVPYEHFAFQLIMAEESKEIK
jgi:hypothetical protein